MCKQQKIKEKIRFRFRVRSNIKEPLDLQCIYSILRRAVTEVFFIHFNCYLYFFIF